MSLCEMLMAAPQWKIRRNLAGDYGVLLNRRRKERGITLLELSVKTKVCYEDIDLAEKGLLMLTADEKIRISKFLKQQKII